jgi:hypothetical protein
LPGDRIKSAYEIAMEKLSRMDGPTDEELRTFRLKQYRPLGEAIARKYLEGGIKDSEIRLKLDKYTGEARNIITEACLELLLEAINLRDTRSGLRAIAGIKIIKPAFDESEIEARYNSLVKEYHALRKAAHEEIEAELKKQLRAEGIRGTAVEPVPDFSPIWLTKEEDIQANFHGGIQDLREIIIRRG